MSKIIYKAALSSLVALSCFITTTATQAYQASASKWQTGPGCEFYCADGISGATATSDGSLYLDLENTPVGPVKGWMQTHSSGASILVDRLAFINVTGTFDTQLGDPAHTTALFTFSGHSDAAMQGVQVKLELRDPADWPNTLFNQTVTINEAGNWQLMIDTPLGLDLMGKQFSFDISAAAGANTLTSLAITPRIQAVPEPGTWALMGLGLVGLAWAGRSRRAT